VAKVATAIVVACLALLVIPGADGQGCDAAQWRIVQRGPTDLFDGIDALSDNDVWVAGAHRVGRSNDPRFFPLLEHWDGTRWKPTVRAPVGAGMEGWFTGVAVVAQDDVWAIGFSYTTRDGLFDRRYRSLLMHFDGTAWRILRTQPPGHFSKLDAITAIGPDDLWIVGTAATQPFDSFGNQQVFAEHWDGVRWRVQSVPLRGDAIEVDDLDASGPSDVWVVGASALDSSSSPVSAHWDGKRWHRVAVDGANSCWPGELGGVAAVSAKTAWAAGDPEADRDCRVKGAPFEHWGGTHWRLNRGGRGTLRDVDSSADGDLWAVGSLDFSRSLVEHWDGSTWRASRGPNAYVLNKVLVLSQNDVWAVGEAGDNDVEVVAHLNG
jgi:hypothetical protein